MRDKHTCQICGEPFSRRWNLERHIIRKHDVPQYFSPIFPNSPWDCQKRFKVQKSNYHRPYSDAQDSAKALGWLLPFVTDAQEEKTPSWYKYFRKFGEISKLTREIAQNPVIHTPINPLKVPVNKIKVQEQQFNHEDHEVVGYGAFICLKCLISHPLSLYQNNPSMMLGSAIHRCDTQRVAEVQQHIENKIDVIATLFNEMPELMFQVVKRWTKGTPMLQADEIQSSPEVLQRYIPVDSKNWASRAIHYRLTFLSNEELADYLSLAGFNTYAYFRTANPNKTHFMRVVASAASKGHIDTNFAGGKRN